ncbi:MAG: PAS domain S-box protein [Bryobacteraceae bacterium]|nr:PAS domain S-box protein [Bryobacteraceae bacterium]
MFDFLRKLFASDFMPHGFCMMWRPEVVWLHVISDALIVLAYYSIPVILFYFVRKRSDIVFSRVFYMFGGFIFFCGTTHLLEIVTLWSGAYRLEGLVKLLTGLISVSTSVMLVRLMPAALALPSHAQLREANRKLAIEVMERSRTEERFRTLLEAAPDAMVITGSSGLIEIVNTQAERLFGWSRHEMLGRPLEILIPARFRERHRHNLKAFAGQPSMRPMGAGLQLFGLRKDDSEFPAEISLSPLQTGEGLLVTAVVRDVTQRVQAEEAIQRLNAELEQRVAERTAELERSNADLQQFAYAASHDLREPVRMIAVYGQLLERKNPEADAETKLFIQTIVDGARRMNRLIQDLLIYSSVSEGKKGAAAVSPEEALRAAIENLQASIEENRAEVRWHDLSAVIADPTQLAQVFQNLIGNAIKYRTEAPPRIEVWSEPEKPGWRKLCVRDNGIGVPAEHRTRIFEMFKRLHGKEKEGSGLGLAICQRIVHRQGGRIWVEPAGEAGSVFCFTLPAPLDA